MLEILIKEKKYIPKCDHAFHKTMIQEINAGTM